ncbi:hypothetical protein M8J77_015455 [Diaphorina citri]|nr:hypothetical protein M8J77_015455 [Diaphorina citri]
MRRKKKGGGGGGEKEEEVKEVEAEEEEEEKLEMYRGGENNIRYQRKNVMRTKYKLKVEKEKKSERTRKK